jgi:hypothetical protein
MMVRGSDRGQDAVLVGDYRRHLRRSDVDAQV